MKRFSRLLILGALAAGSMGIAATEVSFDATDKKVMPVLVQVDAQGHVTHVLPATNLSPTLTQALRDTLQKWITGPAIKDEHGVASQSIYRVMLHLSPRTDGQYDATFDYVSSTPAPQSNSSSYWRWNGSQLALVTGSDARHMAPNFRRVQGVPPSDSTHTTSSGSGGSSGHAH